MLTKVIRAVDGTESRAAPGTAHEGQNLCIGDLRFAIHLSQRRRTMQITVERGGALILSAPPDIDEAQLRQFVEEKQFWIYTKLAEKERLQRQVPTKEYVDGEGFVYLGRSHRLKLVDDAEASIKSEATGRPELRLTQGRFLLTRSAVANGREHFVRWYSDRARFWLAAQVAQYQSRMEACPAGVKVQDLGYRWGSCGKGNWLYFHWKTILLPARIAEYVVVHEIAHLHERHHTLEFWLRVERAMPDFARRKVWLAEHGMDVEGV